MVISILMSTYNGEKYLREQLDSIMNQELSADMGIEVVIRDDGSTDKTIDILNFYKDKYKDKITYYIGENIKPERSFWHLVQHCSQSDYYAFCDQDDVWFPNKLLRAIKALKDQPNQEIPLLYSSDVMVTDKDLNPLSNMNTDKIYTDLGHVLIYNVSTGCTVVFNNAARTEFIKYDMNNYPVIMHDRLADLLTAMFGKIIYDPKPSMYYRQHGNNVCGEQSLGRIKSTIKRIKRFFGTSNSIRSNRAKMLLHLYGDRLSEEQKELLHAVGYYKEDRHARKQLMRNVAFSRGKGKDFFLHWAIRLKLI